MNLFLPWMIFDRSIDEPRSLLIGLSKFVGFYPLIPLHVDESQTFGPYNPWLMD